MSELEQGNTGDLTTLEGIRATVLSGDKRRVLAEAFRVLRPGGRFAVSDVIVRDGLPEPVRPSMPLWTGCVAGALEEREFLDLLTEVGFENASIEPTRIYTRDGAPALLEGPGLEPALVDAVEARIMSGFVRATKPGALRSAKPIRRLETLGKPAKATRACGCDDECCT